MSRLDAILNDSTSEPRFSGILWSAPAMFRQRQTGRPVSQLSLALIENASEQTFGAEGISIRGVFDKETRRKPLAFAAYAVRYGI
jgi:hypothetical protein